MSMTDSSNPIENVLENIFKDVFCHFVYAPPRSKGAEPRKRRAISRLHNAILPLGDIYNLIEREAPLSNCSVQRLNRTGFLGFDFGLW